MPKSIALPRKLNNTKADVINSNLVHLRDGEVVLYKRENSGKWQARYKLKNRWQRISTKEKNMDYAAKVACEAYDKARFLDDEDIVITSKKFGAVAKAVVNLLQKELDEGGGKVVYYTYITVINKYLVPFFEKYNVNSINHEALSAYDKWRTKQMGKKPRASTITNHNTALNRVLEYAIDMGYMSKIHIPKLKNDGTESEPRPAFTKSEYKSLVGYMTQWSKQGHTQRTKDMRELLRDYVLILTNTGMRHGTEALGLKWKDIKWVKGDGGEKILELSVNGKTGERTLIARHNTQDYLERLQKRNPTIAKITFDALIKKRVNDHVFKLRDGTITANLNGTFRTLMRDSGISREGDKNKTLYSLRHTYATLAILEENMDIYQLSKQMGTSVAMIEKYYGHIKPANIASKLAGKRMVKLKVVSKGRQS